MESKNLKPTQGEAVFLQLSYNRFIDLFKEIESNDFWKESPLFRFSRLRDIFSVYAELTNYEPISHILKEMENSRIVENELGKELFLTIRNVVSHFPFFDAWDDVKFTQELINWEGKSRTIDKFLKKFEGRDSIKYRMWHPDQEEFSHVVIRFPENYSKNEETWLKDVLPEKEGIRFSIRLMLRVLLQNVQDSHDIIKELYT